LVFLRLIADLRFGRIHTVDFPHSQGAFDHQELDIKTDASGGSRGELVAQGTSRTR
jgi:hypothetical protein